MATRIQEKKRNSGMISYKEFTLATKKPSVSSRTISGYLAVFGNKDSDSDIIVKGAFSKSITDRGPESASGNKIAFLWQHDMREPLGKITKLQEDDYGLYFEAELDEIDQAERALKQLNSGTLDKFSIGFRYVWDKMEYDDQQDAFICKELQLFEGSVVTLAANDATYYAGLKGEQLDSEIDTLHGETESFIKGLSAPKQYELRQLLTKHTALAKTEPHRKDALREESKPPAKSRFGKIGAQIATH